MTHDGSPNLIAETILAPARSIGTYLGLYLLLMFTTISLSSEPAMAGDCDMTLEQTWMGELTATAQVSGACSAADISLTVRNSANEVVWNGNYVTDSLFGFYDITDANAMRMAMGDWFNVRDTRSSTLPEWPEGADAPNAGEFPFYVEENITREDYSTVRDADFPMVCYVQGMESMLCLVKMPEYKDLVRIGVQSFPG